MPAVRAKALTAGNRGAADCTAADAFLATSHFNQGCRASCTGGPASPPTPLRYRHGLCPKNAIVEVAKRQIVRLDDLRSLRRVTRPCTHMRKAQPLQKG